MRVLVTGAGGQFGHDFARLCVESGDDVVALDRATLDVGDRDAVASAVDRHRPEVVVNAAAWTAVDACESNAARASRDNADAVRYLRAACDRQGAHLVQISTDYVFDGTLDRPYREDDATNPLSVYGQSKLAGEQAAGPEATIVRTSWVCGEHGQNMVKTILRLAGEQPVLRFVDDQRGHPSFTADLAPLIRRLAVDRRPGLHHVTNQGAVSPISHVRENRRPIRVTIAKARPSTRPRGWASRGSFETRIDRKMMLSIPRTISRKVRVRKETQAEGSESSSIKAVPPPASRHVVHVAALLRRHEVAAAGAEVERDRTRDVDG